MSYSNYAYIGWYAIVTPTTDKIQVGEVKTMVCATNERHKHGGNAFCGVCGAKVISRFVPEFQQISMAHHFFDERDPDTLQYVSLGHATIEDLEALGNCHVIFPEFLPKRFKAPVRKEIIMAPGYLIIGDLRNCDSTVTEYTPQSPPSNDWITLLSKVLNTTDIELKYGTVIEAV